MAIDFNVEKLFPVTAAGAMVPGGGVTVGTIRKWRDVGIGGVKLECILIGAFWYTSKEAIERFIAERNQPKGVPAHITRTPAQQRRGNEAAKHELRKRGLIDGIPGEKAADRARRLNLG